MPLSGTWCHNPAATNVTGVFVAVIVGVAVFVTVNVGLTVTVEVTVAVADAVNTAVGGVPVIVGVAVGSTPIATSPIYQPWKSLSISSTESNSNFMLTIYPA
jgi:hypothetical protein